MYTGKGASLVNASHFTVTEILCSLVCIVVCNYEAMNCLHPSKDLFVYVVEKVCVCVCVCVTW